MSQLDFNINIEEISSKLNGIKKDIERDLKTSIENLATMTHAKTLELATSELKSLAQTYTDNLAFNSPTANLWIISLKEPALWIEEGRKSGFMEELLNGKSSHVGKHGRYAVIPFSHNPQGNVQSDNARMISGIIKRALQKEKIYIRKIERTPEGSPRVGLLHKLDVETPILKSHHKYPVTYGVRVYQNVEKSGRVRKDILTFRTITEKHKQEGLWMHPGRKGSKFMDQALEWAINEWQREVLPSILKKYR